jgi:hypothetical protein
MGEELPARCHHEAAHDPLDVLEHRSTFVIERTGPLTAITFDSLASVTVRTAFVLRRHSERQLVLPSPWATRRAMRCMKSAASGNQAAGPFCRSSSPLCESWAIVTFGFSFMRRCLLG